MTGGRGAAGPRSAGKSENFVHCKANPEIIQELASQFADSSTPKQVASRKCHAMKKDTANDTQRENTEMRHHLKNAVKILLVAVVAGFGYYHP